jgi:hypothetical protein
MQVQNDIKVEAVYPDGTVMVRNAFVMENRASHAGDPKWPRGRLYDLAMLTMQRWNETYGIHNNARLRVAT